MTPRFIRSRWSLTRKRIHVMAPGDSLRLPRSQYFNAYATQQRFNDAYQGERKWKLTVAGNTMTIQRLL